jgi:ketose-bisphosphate aldolase
MGLERLSRILQEAETNHYAVGYFEAWDTYSFEAVLEAAEEENSPVVLGFGGVMMDQPWFGRLGIKPLGAYGRVIVEQARVPAAYLLNEVLELDHIRQGVRSGFNAVMLDSSHFPYQQNVAVTRQVVSVARPLGIEVQAELGQLPDFGAAAAGHLTDPQQARDFVKETGVDFLAVAIGNVHLQTEGSFHIDVARLREIRRQVSVPLVIHGGSGFPADSVQDAIQNGVSLFHLGTVLKKSFFEFTRAHLRAIAAERPDYQALVGSRKPTDFLHAGKQEIKNVVKSFMRLYGSSKKAGSR